ncbi:toxin [Roseateles sp. DAIF2]|uniref:SpvB/TcaC N-terminal domain-containing protein n=1 Tax=Roseateles sp. DAIF2 TaxID=2714952 RepID=UPI0018A2C6B9|nr:SpvB/TcaC N-terminal domain-containing protein [Roseateles sp. DAIF2]QPF72251.1 toxin [Roseateles sp. DAIF2]
MANPLAMRDEAEPSLSSAPEGSGDASFLVAAPAVSLPKGGGAIRGIGEKFSVDAATGTGSATVPIATSPGRGGFGPQLSLTYDSAAGNGLFGLGWQLSSPSVARRTDKLIPRYLDAHESDVFAMSGDDDLVPVDAPGGGHFEDRTTAPGFVIHRYRPRIEKRFARIERWTRVGDPTDVHWRSWSGGNIVSVFGKDASSRIVDPTDPLRIFEWLLCESRDDKGNAVIYRYKAEDATGIDLSRACEANRGDALSPLRGTNRYLKRILYGNRVPLLAGDGTRPAWLLPAQIDGAGWMFEAVFDYGEHDPVAPRSNDAQDWGIRRDPFSTCRAGFEVRTYRLCRRVLMFHHFPDVTDVGANCLVRATELEYRETPAATFLSAVTQRSYRRRAAGGYLDRALPKLEFEYSQPVVGTDISDLDAASLENLPQGAAAPHQWADLDGEGLTGLLSQQSRGWFYKRNESPLNRQVGAHTWSPRFAPLESLPAIPAVSSLASPRVKLMDLAGDGQLDVVQFEPPVAGFYERTGRAGWKPRQAFEVIPNLPWSDANLRFVDLTGDGRADVLITEEHAFTWHASLGERGFDEARRTSLPANEEQGPRVVFANAEETILMGDMSGDGLTDIVRIRNGEVCYWPNLGYGCFGARVSMDNAPWFASQEEFDARRLRLADVDGSGPSDLIYLAADAARLWVNESGNGWSAATLLTALPPIDNVGSVTAIDVLGNGTTALVWSSPLVCDVAAPLKVLSLMADGKPHLLTGIRNNLGAETRIYYAPSTWFYLRDRERGTPWITRLPFPVHVVERVEVYDRVSRNRFVTRYSYHHGCFDGTEREFRGFGRVDQTDTEELDAVRPAGAAPIGSNFDQNSWIPPTLTRTWFHTGVHAGRERISRYFAGTRNAADPGEYYREPGLTDAQAGEALLDDTTLPDALSAEEEVEACRALKGSILRQEVYALDETPRATHPYVVSEHSYAIRRLQAKGDKRNAVFFAHSSEVLTFRYERNPTDPRISHELTLEVDAYGNVIKEAAIGYGRRAVSPAELPRLEDRERQLRTLVTYAEYRATNHIDSGGDYRLPVRCESRSFELTGYLPSGPGMRFRKTDFVAPDVTPGQFVPVFDSEIAYEDMPVLGRQRRCVKHSRTLFRPNDLGVTAGDASALLPLGQMQSLALQGESFRLTFTPGFLQRVYTRGGVSLLPANVADVLSGTGVDRGGYVSSASLKASALFPAADVDGWWWTPSGRAFLSRGQNDTAGQERAHARAHFHLAHRFRDPFGHTTALTFDAHDFLVVDTEDAAGNRITAGERSVAGVIDPGTPGNDYRLLMPVRIMDANRNRAHVILDVLGMVVGKALLGKPEEALGDSFAGFDPDPPTPAILAQLANPLANPAALLGNAAVRIVYDVHAYERTKGSAQPQPVSACSISRETHASDGVPAGGLKVQVGFAYWDAFGQEIQRKVRAEAGKVPARDGTGAILIGADGQPQMTAGAVSPRWVGSGWTVFNNKGKPVRQFEPFFSDTHAFEADVRVGVSPVQFYDPLGRLTATLHPDHTWAKLRFDAWHNEAWDVTDTVAIADPSTDADVGPFFKRLRATMYLPTWFAARQGGALGAAERAIALKSAVASHTPTVAHGDALGRTFLTIAHNKTRYSDAPAGAPPVENFLQSRVGIDIEGRSRVLRDARDRVILENDFDMTGRRARWSNMEAGARWLLPDAMDQPLQSWNDRRKDLRVEYDALRRATAQFLTENGAPQKQVGRTVYGESVPAAEASNLRGKTARVFDQAGVVTTGAFDFKGNPLRTQRQFAQKFDGTLDWSGPVPLNPEVYDARSRYDALNRVVQSVAPAYPATGAGFSVLQSTFNDAGLLERVDVWLAQAAVPAGLLHPATADVPVVAGIDYDAKGQRTRIDYGNQCSTSYAYDPLTMRLRQLVTRRSAFNDCPQPPPPGWPGCQVQNLSYIYDAAGHVAAVRDGAQQAIFFRNRRVEPGSEYTYDALGQLIEATGREHLGQAAAPSVHAYNDASRVGLPAAGNGNALGRYLERYRYDETGNLIQMKHLGTDPSNPGWTRDYVYDEESLLEPAARSNRLTRTTLTAGAVTETYSNAGDGYDAHGNAARLPHLQAMHWDFTDQLQMTQRQVVNGQDADGVAHHGERTWYVYDSTGARVRKVTVAAMGQVREERFYLGGFEIYRRNGANPLTRQTLHVRDDTRRVALIETRTQGNEPGVPPRKIRYQFPDLLSAVLELDEDAAIASYEEYTPFGSTAYQAVGATVEVPKRFRFGGVERDAETGFTYHSTRYYAPWLGRWTSCDPIGTADGGNLYCYVHNSPVSSVDPTGTQDKPVDATAAFQAEIRRLAGEANSGPVLDILPDGTVRTIYNAKETVIVVGPGGSEPRDPAATPPAQPQQQPPPEPNGEHGFYPMGQAEKQLTEGAIESFKRGKIFEGLIGWGLREFMHPFAMAENLMPYNIPDHFLAAGQYGKRWIWYDMRGQSGRGLMELAKGESEADAVVGSLSLWSAAARALMPKPSLQEPIGAGWRAQGTPLGASPFNDERGFAGGDNCTRCTAAFIDTMNSTSAEMGEFQSSQYPKMPRDTRNIANINNYLKENTGVSLGDWSRNSMPADGFYVIHVEPYELNGKAVSPHVMVGWRFFGENNFYCPQQNFLYRPIINYYAFPLQFGKP